MRSRHDLDWLPRPNIDIGDPYFRRPKSVPRGAARVIWPKGVNAHRLVRISKAEAFVCDTRWDEVSLDELHRIPVEAVRLICTGKHDPAADRRCGHQCDIPVGFILGLAAQVKGGRYLKFAEIKPRLYCRFCGAFDPIMLPMKLRAP